MTENFSDLLLALLVAMGLVYFVLAAQFESFLIDVYKRQHPRSSFH